MKRIFGIFGQKQATMGSAAFVLMTMVATSRVLGLVRDRLLAARFAPDELGVYIAAFRIPNFLFELLVMGTLTSAFIPVFTRYLTQNKEKEGWHVASTLITVSTLILLACSIPMLIWTEQLSRVLAPGFTPAQITQMASFTRFMVLAQVIPLLIGNFFTGILQSYTYFLVPAMAPVMYNVGIISGIVAFTPTLGLFAPVVGVGIGAMLFVLIQVPLLIHLGYRYGFSLDFKHSGVREVGKLIGPRTLGLAVSQIDSTVDLVLASLLGARMVTVFNFAQNLQQVPIGLFGVTVAQAALPTLSASTAKADMDGFKQAVTKALHQILFFVLPTAALFIVLRIPVVRLVFGASKFDWEATVLTGATLSMFSLSLAAQAAVHVLARGFYALLDSKTPVIMGIIAIATNIIASILFIRIFHLEVWSLGLSASLASLVNAGLLLVFLDKKVGKFSRYELFVPPLKMLIAAVIAGAIIFIPLKLLDQLVFDTTRTFGLLLLTGVAGLGGMSTYFFLTWVFDVVEVRSFFALIKRVRKPRSVLLTPAAEVVSGQTPPQLQ